MNVVQFAILTLWPYLMLCYGSPAESDWLTSLNVDFYVADSLLSIGAIEWNYAGTVTFSSSVVVAMVI